MHVEPSPTPARGPRQTITTTMNIGVLASHEGTTLQRVLDACAGGRIAGRVALVVSNNSQSGTLRRAHQAGVTFAHLSSTTHPDPGALDSAIRNVLGDAVADTPGASSANERNPWENRGVSPYEGYVS